MTYNDYNLWLMISTHCPNSPNYPISTHTISITPIPAHPLSYPILLYTQCSYSTMTLSNTISSNQHIALPSLSHTYNHSIATLLVSKHNHYHTVHNPTIQPSSSKTFPHAHAISLLYTYNQYPHQLYCHTYSFPVPDTWKCIFPSYVLFNNPTQTLMIATLQVIVTLFQSPLSHILTTSICSQK